MPEHLDQEYPDSPRLWLGALVIAAALLGGLEALWRSRGYFASQGRMDAAMLVFNLGRAHGDAFAVAGDSGAMAAVSLAGIESCSARPSTMVACFSCNAIAIAEHVAADPGFKGVLMLQVDDNYDERDAATGAGQLDEALAVTFLERIDAALELPINERIVIRNEELGLRRIMRHLVEPSDEWLPFPRHNMRVNARSEIYMYPDTVPANDVRRSQTRPGPPPPASKTLPADGVAKLVARYVELDRALRARGGHLVLLQLPHTLPPASTLWTEVAAALPQSIVDLSHPSAELVDAFEHSPDRAFGTHLVATMRDRFTSELCKQLDALPGVRLAR